MARDPVCGMIVNEETLNTSQYTTVKRSISSRKAAKRHSTVTPTYLCVNDLARLFRDKQILIEHRRFDSDVRPETRSSNAKSKDLFLLVFQL